MILNEKFYKKLLFFSLLFAFCILINSNYVKASSYDNTPPTIESVRFVQDKLYSPDTLKVELGKLVEDGSGVKAISLSLSKSNDKISSIDLYCESATPIFTNDNIIIEFDVPEDIYTDVYYIDTISIVDFKSNSASYYRFGQEDLPYKLKQITERKETCTVENSIKIYGDQFDASTSLDNPNIGTIISNMEDGQTANLFPSGSNAIVPKAAFDAIKGTNKKINVAVSDGVKWVFNGKDITGTTKNVDCKVDISAVQNEDYGTSDELMQMKFASNGLLPGKATIKLKSDYLSRLYNMTDKLFLYYLGDKELILEDDDVKTMPDGDSNWCVYEITHNSTFLLSNKTLQYKVPAPKPYVKLNTSSLVMQVKQSSSALKVTDKLKTDKVKKWTSSKPSVVSVNSRSGKLKAKKPGTAYITVQLNSGVKTKCKIKVQRSAVRTKSITVGNTKVRLKKGKTYTIHVTRKPLTANDGKVTYKSSKSKIVTVNSKGKLKAKKKGKATITVKAGKKVKRITVTVK